MLGDFAIPHGHQCTYCILQPDKKTKVKLVKRKLGHSGCKVPLHTLFSSCHPRGNMLPGPGDSQDKWALKYQLSLPCSSPPTIPSSDPTPSPSGTPPSREIPSLGSLLASYYLPT